MNNIEITFYYLVIVAGIIIFSLNVTAPNWFAEIIFKFMAKILPLFLIGYSMLQLAKNYNLI
jgi:hypothetical protein